MKDNIEIQFPMALLDKVIEIIEHLPWRYVPTNIEREALLRLKYTITNYLNHVA